MRRSRAGPVLQLLGGAAICAARAAMGCSQSSGGGPADASTSTDVLNNGPDSAQPDGTGANDAPPPSDAGTSDAAPDGSGPSCSGPALTGSFTITNSLDVTQLQSYAKITGDLLVNAAGLTVISLPSLCSIGGSFAGPSAPFIQAPNLTELDLPALTTVGGRFGLYLNASLSQVSVPRLTTVGDRVDISGDAMGALSTLDLPALTTVGGVFNFFNPTITTLNVPNLVSAGALWSFNTVIPLLSFPKLASVGEFIVGSANCADPPNRMLVELEFPKLGTVGSTGNDGAVQFGEDSVLPLCRAQALVQQLRQAGWIGQPFLGVDAGVAGCTLATGPCP